MNTSYKDHNIVVFENWQTNSQPTLSRFIIFEVSKDKEKSRLAFNHDLLIDITQGKKSNESKLKIEGLEIIKSLVDNNSIFLSKLHFYELYPGNFLPHNIPPDWILKKIDDLLI